MESKSPEQKSTEQPVYLRDGDTVITVTRTGTKALPYAWAIHHCDKLVATDNLATMIDAENQARWQVQRLLGRVFRAEIDT